jgi:hypothetical protein
MIDIFLIAASIEHAQHIVARLEESGVRYRLRTAYGSARQLRAHARLIRSADLLIVDAPRPNARELDGIEEALACWARRCASACGTCCHGRPIRKPSPARSRRSTRRRSRRGGVRDGSYRSHRARAAAARR